jgi:hypothetical protein
VNSPVNQNSNVARLTTSTAKRLNWTMQELAEHVVKEYPELVKMGWQPVREIQRQGRVIVVLQWCRSGRFRHVIETHYAGKHPVTGQWKKSSTLKMLMHDWPKQ